jgi:N-methylhydantoinase B
MERVLKTKEVGITINPGDRVLVEASGGGGWGDPTQRDPAARARDAEEGLV